MRALGIDYGEKRVGIALSDPMQILASPREIIKHDDNDQVVIEELLKIIKKESVSKIIVGLPLNMNGSVGFQAERVYQFVDSLKEHVSIPIVFEDERESSKKVKEAMKLVKSKDERIDDRAAAIILQNYLDYN
ncbi:Holliday junction resolvase RuvX [Mollicutes bacterium LVI A0078]|nr:Holliday junction resolvase RuvX [Mollicutes bacterium LVI A0075]WOO91102.1 Holliday junction resolvase RuvX [Mollicutes bacterium LVI A0078]